MGFLGTIYLSGICATMISVLIAALKMQGSHQMSRSVVCRMALTVGAVWPLLLVAVTQVVIFFLLIKGLAILRARISTSVAVKIAVAVDTSIVA